MSVMETNPLKLELVNSCSMSSPHMSALHQGTALPQKRWAEVSLVSVQLVHGRERSPNLDLCRDYRWLPGWTASGAGEREPGSGVDTGIPDGLGGGASVRKTRNTGHS